VNQLRLQDRVDPSLFAHFVRFFPSFKFASASAECEQLRGRLFFSTRLDQPWPLVPTQGFRTRIAPLAGHGDGLRDRVRPFLTLATVFCQRQIRIGKTPGMSRCSAEEWGMGLKSKAFVFLQICFAPGCPESPGGTPSSVLFPAIRDEKTPVGAFQRIACGLAS